MKWEKVCMECVGFGKREGMPLKVAGFLGTHLIAVTVSQKMSLARIRS